MPGLYHCQTGSLHTTDSAPSTHSPAAGLLKETLGPTSSPGPNGLPTGYIRKEAQRGAEVTGVCDKTGCDTGMLSIQLS